MREWICSWMYMTFLGKKKKKITNQTFKKKMSREIKETSKIFTININQPKIAFCFSIIFSDGSVQREELIMMFRHIPPEKIAEWCIAPIQDEDGDKPDPNIFGEGRASPTYSIESEFPHSDDPVINLVEIIFNVSCKRCKYGLETNSNKDMMLFFFFFQIKFKKII